MISINQNEIRVEAKNSPTRFQPLHKSIRLEIARECSLPELSAGDKPFIINSLHGLLGVAANSANIGILCDLCPLAQW